MNRASRGLCEGYVLHFAQDAQFMQLPAAGKIGGGHLSRSRFTAGLKRHFPPLFKRGGTRPCMRVRIYSLHLQSYLWSSSRPTFQKSGAGRLFAFAHKRLCRHLYPHGRRVLPATCLPILPTGGGCRIEHPESVEGLSPSLRSGRSILQLPAAGKIGACSDFPPSPTFESGAGRSPSLVQAHYTIIFIVDEHLDERLGTLY